MDAGDGLHQASVAVSQSFPIQRLEAAHIGGAVLCQGDLLFAFHQTRHAGYPETFVVRQIVINVFVEIFQKTQATVDGV